MAQIRFSQDEKSFLIQKLQIYFNEELSQELGRFDAEFLLDFLCEELGPHFYNQGLQDAQAMLSTRLDELNEAIDQLQRPTTYRR